MEIPDTLTYAMDVLKWVSELEVEEFKKTIWVEASKVGIDIINIHTSCRDVHKRYTIAWGAQLWDHYMYTIIPTHKTINIWTCSNLCTTLLYVFYYMGQSGIWGDIGEIFHECTCLAHENIY